MKLLHDGRCNATTKAGTRCAARIGMERVWCNFHDPQYDNRRAEWSRKGGLASGESRKQDAELHRRTPDLEYRVQRLEAILKSRGWFV